MVWTMTKARSEDISNSSGEKSRPAPGEKEQISANESVLRTYAKGSKKQREMRRMPGRSGTGKEGRK